MSSEIVETLKNCDLFASLSEAELEVIASGVATAWKTKEYKSGDHIFEQGQHSTKLYVIADGQVLLERSLNVGDRSSPWPLGMLGKGRAVGWSALLFGPRSLSASAVCQKPTRVISIEGSGLRSILEKQPQIGFKIMDRLAYMLGERLQAAYNTVEANL